MGINKNIQSCVINNGITSDYFTLQRGVRQGDPLSPYLFVIAAEVLGIAVRQDKEIKKKNIRIGKEATKLMKYADDMTAVLSDIKSAHALFKLPDHFQKLSGLGVNRTKTEGMWIGSSGQNKAKPLGIKWPDEPINARRSGYTILTIQNCFMRKILLKC